MMAAILLTIALPPNARADVRFEFGLNGGYTSNLFFDYTDILDLHTTGTATIKYYALPWLELNLSGDKSVYDEIPGLSSQLGRIGFTAIPLGQENKLAVSISGSYDGRRYHRVLGSSNNNSFNTRLSAGYRVRPALAGRLGGTIQTTSYLDSESGDKRSAEVFAGVNATILRNNSFDLEVGYGVADYRTIDRSLPILPFGPKGWDFDAALRSATLRSIYISPRISRPLGSKTGINLTLMYRNFQNADSALVLGSATGLLSPWSAVWEGKSITLTVKSYLTSTLTVSTGVGYWSKTYLQTLEPGTQDYLVRSEWGTAREDIQKRVYLQVLRPITIWRDGLLQPRIQFDYIHNNSTNKLFDFSGFSIDTGVSLQF